MTALSVAVAFDAPAKINLALHVVGRRSDGYHLLESLSVFAQFADRLSVESSGEDRFHVHGPRAAEVPAGEDNLVLRARDALRHRYGGTAAPVSIALEKNLPAAAGLGGGSSDAAAALLALTRLWRLPAGMNELQDIGLALGADLPMCLERRPLVARGVGEQLQPLPQVPALPMVLANPGVGVSTPAVFGALARRDNPPLPEVPRFPDSVAVAAWLAGTRNDLTEPALACASPIADALDALDRQGAMLARMSGSGATCFGLFREMADAEQAATQLSAERPDWFVVATIAQGTQD